MVVDVRFENWEMTLNQGIYLRIFASLFIFFLVSEQDAQKNFII